MMEGTMDEEICQAGLVASATCNAQEGGRPNSVDDNVEGGTPPVKPYQRIVSSEQICHMR